MRLNALAFFAYAAWPAAVMTALALGGPATALDHSEYLAKDDRITVYLQGAYHGMLLSDAEHGRLGQPPLFCPPGKLNILGRQLYSVIDGYLARHPDHIGFPVEAMLLKGLQEDYPCE